MKVLLASALAVSLSLVFSPSALVSPRGAAAPLPTVAGAASAAQRFIIVPAESEVIYRVSEVLFNEGNRLNVAVGKTRAVRGEILVDRANPRNSRIGAISIDISTFQSDSARRDRAIQTRWLESARFPIAEFRPTAVEGLPAAYTEGEPLKLRVTGDLRVRDVTRPTTFEMTVVLRGTTLAGSAITTIKMTDFGFDPPSIFGILRTENEARLEFQFVARPPQV